MYRVRAAGRGRVRLYRRVLIHHGARCAGRHLRAGRQRRLYCKLNPTQRGGPYACWLKPKTPVKSKV